MHEAAATVRSASTPRLIAAAAERLVGSLFGALQYGALTIETPAGKRLTLEGREPGPVAEIAVHRWRFLRRILGAGDVGFAEGYLAGEWSTPSLAALLRLAARNPSVDYRVSDLAKSRLALKLRHALNRNTRRGSRRNIAAHYDLGNAFYAQWLDASMSYSSALYASTDQSLEAAQTAKIDHAIDLLDIRDGDAVLEIGCGWGGFAERLLQRCACSVVGLTLSTEQLTYARQRLAEAIDKGRCDVRLQDYRDVAGLFDRIVSIEMLEAVGAAYWSSYFATLAARLRAGGVAVIQAITIDESRFNSYRRRPDFIQKYIFPGGMLPTKSILRDETAKAGLRLTAEHCFADSYARTLHEWAVRFQRAWPEIAALGFDERFKRMWEYYLAYCQAGFESRIIDVGQYRLVRA